MATVSHLSKARPAVQSRKAEVPFPARLVCVKADGLLTVDVADQGPMDVAWLEQGALGAVELAPGDLLLILPSVADDLGVALGRIGRYVRPSETPHVSVRSTETLSLQCGESMVDLRADGKVLIRGHDVLVRAKGTKRIRAGTVSIN